MRKTILKISLLLLINYTFAQEVDISRYLYLLRLGDVESVRDAVDSLKKIYPNSVNLKYLEANLMQDGEQAVKIYYDIALTYPDNEYSDDALLKVFQFYYAKGEYEQAKRELERLKKLYPSSPYAGIKVRFPGVSETSIVDKSGRKPSESKVDCNYSLQVGAFLDRKNAEKEKEFFESRGYGVEVHTKFKDGKLFFVVWVGCFYDRDEADAMRIDIKRRFGKESFIISTLELR
ncbi:MAG: SPOR domain-containing protein [Candidatus Kryptonium sp.]